ncbi:MAG: CobW family GTP-binding protein [Rubrivivax sp.]
MTLAPSLPTVVIGGYLGAGKTTLVNRLLRAEAAAPAHERERIAVLVNDFGDVSIDADLIEGAAGDVLSLAGGCICCAFGADLAGALAKLGAREPPPERVLIETSGVGLPAAVAATASLARGVRVEGIVVVADASAVRRQAADRYVGTTVLQQLRQADKLYVAKGDLADAPPRAALEAWLRERGVAVLVLWSDDSASTELRARHFGERPALASAAAAAFTPRPLAPPRDHAERRYAARTQRFDAPVDAAALAAQLLAEGVVRAKGVLLDEGGHWVELHLAGGRIDLRPARRPPERGTDARAPAAGRLVTIVLRA